MGEVIHLEERRRRRATRLAADAPASASAAPASAGVEFLFDLACPFTYLAAERVDRAFPVVSWTPASGLALRCGALPAPDELEAAREAAEARAHALRLPLEWPERWPVAVPEAMRVDQFAAERGRGPGFVLAAARLAFAGGFDLVDPEILADAAAAAGLGGEEYEAAVRDSRRDVAVQMAARRLLSARVHHLPALCLGGRVFAGEERIAEAVAGARELVGAVAGS